MRVLLEFQGNRLELYIEDDRTVGIWNGPETLSDDVFDEQLLRELQTPRSFPALKEAIVPGDRLLIPFDPDVPKIGRIIALIAGLVEERQPVEIQAITHGPIPPSIRDDWPERVALIRHDPNPEDPTQAMAYLASTAEGRRIYLNRAIAEADVVVPVGLLAFDPIFGYRGPWRTIFPACSDQETDASVRSLSVRHPGNATASGQLLEESIEVSWLLGSFFQIGVMPARCGPAQVIAGATEAVRSAGLAAIDEHWTFRPHDQADLVIAGLGSAGFPSTIDDLARGLETAVRFVRPGGRLAILSQVEGPIGTAVRRLGSLQDPSRDALAALRGAEDEPDYPAAIRIANALARADIYLHSLLDAEEVERLTMIRLDNAIEVERLAAISPSTIIMSHADWTRVDLEVN